MSRIVQLSAMTVKSQHLQHTGEIQMVAIEMTRQLDKVYRLDHAVTKTQKMILSAFGMDWNHLDNMLNTTYYNYKEEGAY